MAHQGVNDHRQRGGHGAELHASDENSFRLTV
jgi:hypothetical protein